MHQLTSTESTPSTTILNLDVKMDNDFSTKSHVNKLSRSCFYSMRCIRAIRRSPTTEAAKTLVSSFVYSKIDYCNTVFAGLSVSTTDRFDDVLHAAARLISGRQKYIHITPELESNYTGFGCIRIWNTNCVKLYSSYIEAMYVPVSYVTLRSRLRSAGSGRLFYSIEQRIRKEGFCLCWLKRLEQSTNRDQSISYYLCL